MPFKSICLDEMSDAQRDMFRELGIRPGDRLYIKKLRTLTDDTLRSAVQTTGGSPNVTPAAREAVAGPEFGSRPADEVRQ